VRARCVIVPKGEGESARKKLSEAGLLRGDLSIRSDGSSVIIPILDGPDPGYPEREEDFEPAASKIKSYKEIAAVPENLRPLLPTSFDIIGDIAVFKLADGLAPYAAAIGHAMLDASKNLASAALDQGVEGELRVRSLHVVAGRQSTRTIHREYGIELELDPSLVYFSPRLASERWRIAQAVGDGERVLDMFCGVGPFSILIAKKAEPSSVECVDSNAHAIEFLRANIAKNKVTNVSAHLGDAHELAPKLGPADRIIMNLPHSAHEFLPEALAAAAPGAWLHVYQVVDKGAEERRARELEGLAPRTICMEWRVVHPYSPGSSIVAYDMHLSEAQT
jgi:tRNA (guanine37-N1)-methyltransferase